MSATSGEHHRGVDVDVDEFLRRASRPQPSPQPVIEPEAEPTSEVEGSRNEAGPRWKRWGSTVVVFALALAITLPFAPDRIMLYDGNILAEVAMSLVDHGTPLVHPIYDGFGLNTPYSGYGLGMSIAMAAAYKVGTAIGADPLHSLAVTNTFLYAATVAAVFALLRRRSFRPAVVVGVTAVLAVATPLLAYSVSSFSEPAVALCVALALIGLDSAEKGRWVGGLGVGAAVGAAVLTRTDSLFTIGLPMLVALWVISARRWRPVVLAVVGAAPFAIVWMAYNAARFGTPLSSGYAAPVFNHPFLSGFYGLALSPARGVLVYVPVLLLAIAVLPFQRGGNRVLAVLAFTLLVLRLAFYARWWSWYGGASWGPRFMLPILPAFAPAIAEAVTRWRRHVLVYVPIALSLLVSVVGYRIALDHIPPRYTPPAVNDISQEILDEPSAQRRVEREMAQWTAPENVAATDAVMFDWSQFLRAMNPFDTDP